MKKYTYDYMTPKEQDLIGKYFQRSNEIIKMIKKLEAERTRLLMKVMRLNETAEQRMKDAKNSS